MTRTIHAAALSVVLAAATLAGAGQASAGSTSGNPTDAGQANTSQTGTAASERPGRTVTKRVKPGHPPMASRARGKLRLVFKGKRGQRVNLALFEHEAGRPCASRFLLHNGKRVKRFADGYWRLPRTGTYVGVFRWCTEYPGSGNPGKVQLRRARITRVPVDGTSVKMGRNTRVTYLAAVRVTAPVMVRRTGVRDYGTRVVLPNRHTTDDLLASGPLFLAPGSPPRTGSADQGDEASTAGRHLIPVSARARVTASAAQIHEASLDGPATTLTNAGPDRTQHLVSFTGEAGQWVYSESSRGLPAGAWRTRDQLVAPDGTVVTTELGLYCQLDETFCPRDRAAWQLPATGTYQFSRVSAAATETLGLRLAAQAPAMGAGGTTYTSVKPGQWVVGQVNHPTDPAASPTLRASNASTGLTGFRATVVSGWVPRCDVYDTSMGCGDYSTISVSHDKLESSGWWIHRSAPHLVLQVPADATGSVDLSWP